MYVAADLIKMEGFALFLTASTCSLILCLLTRYSSYAPSKEAMVEALKSNRGLDVGPLIMQ